MPIAQQLCQCSGRDGFTRIDGTDTFVCARCGVPMIGYEQKQSGGLAYFRGGPMDTNVYEYSTLLSPDAMALPIAAYKWTQEIITSPSTGNTARVWIWNGDEPVVETTEEVEPPVVQKQQSDTGETTPDQIRERREALSISRPTLAAKAGITVAQLARLEVAGKRPKDGVVDQVVAALAEFEKNGTPKKDDAPLA